MLWLARLCRWCSGCVKALSLGYQTWEEEDKESLRGEDTGRKVVIVRRREGEGGDKGKEERRKEGRGG